FVGAARSFGPPASDNVLTVERDSSTWYYLHDGLGSVTELLDDEGDLAQACEYDAWGIPTVYNPADTEIRNPYLYTGREWDAEISLYYHRARPYSAKLGRFLQTDPAGPIDGPNLYAYVSNIPTVFRDPSGLGLRLNDHNDPYSNMTARGLSVNTGIYGSQDDEYFNQNDAFADQHAPDDSYGAGETPWKDYKDEVEERRRRCRRHAPPPEPIPFLGPLDPRLSLQAVAYVAQQILPEDSAELAFIQSLTDDVQKIEEQLMRAASDPGGTFQRLYDEAVFVEQESGGLFSRWDYMLCELTGGNSILEAYYGVDMVTGERLETIEAVSRGLTGGGQFILTVVVPTLDALGWNPTLWGSRAGATSAAEGAAAAEGRAAATGEGTAAGAGNGGESIPAWRQYELRHGGQQTTMRTTFGGEEVTVRLDKPPTSTTIVDFKDLNWSKPAYQAPFIQQQVVEQFQTQILKYQTIRPNVHLQFSQQPPSGVVRAIREVGGTYSVMP
ncbi:MAG: hypothetical protein JW889_15075, partial [Verrucomicrobia bacterium]|nr:hypothetical protein [Verrucomicrobiota bacterium]